MPEVPCDPLVPFHLAQTGGGIMDMLPMLAIFFIIFYFILIRPQQREKKAQEAMRTNLKKGDEVLTQSGIIAKIAQVKDNHIVLDLDGTARIRVLKESIARRLGEPEGKTAGSTPEASKQEKSETAG